MPSRRAFVAPVSLLLLAVSCLQARQPAPAPAPERTAAYSSVLNIRVTYDPDVFSAIEQRDDTEFPLFLSGEEYQLGIKRLRNVGVLLVKTPQADFFRFFGQQVRYDLIEARGLIPLAPEVDEDFTAQGAEGLRQILHFQTPEKAEAIPDFAPQEPNAAFYIYYHHFYHAPDYFFFVAISRQALTEQQKEDIVALIDTVEFDAQPRANDQAD